MALGRQVSAWTLEAFLEWEDRQEGRYEFDGDQPCAMVGAKAGHHIMLGNGEAAMRAQLKGCVVFRETMKLRMEHTVRYPDLMVVCRRVDRHESSVSDPTVVVEVISDSTSREDRITKNQEYRRVPTIQHYLILEQDSMAATLFSRAAAGWDSIVLSGPDAIIDLHKVAVAIHLRDFYLGLDFEGEEDSR